MVTVDEYLAALADDRREALVWLRQVVRDAVPAAVESMRYGMPYYGYYGDLCAFASQKRYMSFYVMSAGTPLARLRAETNLDIGKGCVRFRRADQLPLDLVREVLVEAAAVNEAQAAAS